MIAICLLAVLLIAIPVLGEERLELTLGDAISAALSSNLSLEEESLLQKIGEADVLEAKGEFDPSFKAGVSTSKRKDPSITTIVSTREKTQNYEVSIGGKAVTGTEYELKLQGSKVDRSDTPFLLINPYYSSDILISITQPLLRGFGISTQESQVLAAEAGLEAARMRAEHRAMEVISDTASAYWELYFARGNLDAAEIALRLAESTLDEVRAKIEAGTLASVEIYKAEAEAAIREERYLSARKAVFDAEDALRAIMNVTEWHGEIVPVEVPPSPEPSPVLEELLADAFENRRDFMQVRSELKGKEILRNYYKNQTLPELDIVGSTGTSGVGSSFGDAFDSSTDGNFYSWEIGVVLEIPIGDRARKGRYLRAMHEAELAELAVRKIRQEITVEVREFLRDMELARESVKASGRSKIASEKRLEAEQERFRLGMATLNDVLLFQQEYADAISSEKRAIADYASSSVRLRKASGTLLLPGE